MSSLALRSASRLSRLISKQRSVLPILSTTTSCRSSSNLTKEDVVDSDGLLQFTTLHEMNHFASIAFKDNPLFGTYKAEKVEENVVKDPAKEKGEFEWMTYGDYGEKIARCRTVLKDIGESCY
jgi:long-chain acyl-CoA synthetase